MIRLTILITNLAIKYANPQQRYIAHHIGNAIRGILGNGSNLNFNLSA